MSGAPGNVPPESLARPVQDGSWPADPFLLLREWAPENGDPDRPLATVATVDTEGMPDARTVLLTAVLDDGVTFHTDARSRKAEQLRVRPVAAFVVRWPESARQVVLRGRVEESSAEEQRIAYERRARYLQLLAWVNTAGFARLPRAERERRWGDADADGPSGEPPAAWTGFHLRPSELMFWEGSAVTASRRVAYRRVGDRWATEALPG
ncbi:pyridoxine/pyridoxamine 5'-phosphate oxidase [Microbacterium marinilacus]|uniref:Pyridoxal 5'-phosphate synthase n=1 Tax=Microbacterium marinilacus TaxID=415209 RepID=A0ABP7BHC1_9MICO|nr:pyridoxamine 5'-phosphate oxidase family protein [Microbacterium marinilacus]MBY0688890.1 pyridoxamine 5'-phosphate oxidase family protein [Microbacterium marinilacus]